MDEAFKQQLALGREHFARGDFEKAWPLLTAVAAQRSDLAEVHHMIGVMHHARQEFSEARASFERALSLDPDFTEAALSLSITCNELGSYAEAKRVVSRQSERTRAHDRIDRYARTKLANLHGTVARAYEELGLFSESVDEYQRALALCPDDPMLRIRMAQALRADGDGDRAVVELQSVIVAHPRSAQARVALGLTLLALGRRDEAEAAWVAALSIDPKHRAAEVYLRMVREGSERPSMLPGLDTLQNDDETLVFTAIGEPTS